MAKRIFLFVLTNILVIATISIVASVFGIGGYVTKSGLDIRALLAFCFLWGMGGSFISLLLSKQMAKWMMGVRIIDPARPGEFAWLVERVHALSKGARLPRLPEVGVYDSPEVNAFATGPSKGNSLVAVSTGLLHSMSPDEVEGVLGHEVAHIQNGDMVTMTLIQGVVNAFTMFLARLIAFAVSQNVREESRGMVMMGVTLALDLLIGLLGTLVVCWFSRQREFRADRGSAALLGGERKMVEALKALMPMRRYPLEAESGVASLKIYGKEGGLLALFSTHPPLEQRIRALTAGTR